MGRGKEYGRLLDQHRDVLGDGAAVGGCAKLELADLVVRELGRDAEALGGFAHRGMIPDVVGQFRRGA